MLLLAAWPAAQAQSTDVINGTPANIEQWRGFANLTIADEPIEKWAVKCGATLIGPQHLVTAAHCFAELTAPPEQFYDVLFGPGKISSTKTPLGTRYAIESVTVHPQFNAENLSHDVAVVKLKTRVMGIAPVPYMTSLKQEAKFAPENRDLWVAGFGMSKLFPSVYPTTLLEHAAIKRSNAYCEGLPKFNFTMDETQFCAGGYADGASTHFGDSGGPIAARDAKGRWGLVGITSGIVQTMTYNLPAVYSRLAVLGPWVKQTVAATR